MSLLHDPDFVRAARAAPGLVRETDERYTPDWIWRRCGPIALDPCAPPHNPTGARLHWSLPTNGLLEPWPRTDGYGCVWVNPPYSSGQVALWARKVAGEYERGVGPVYVLTSGDLSAAWFSLLWDSFSCCVLLAKRVPFIYPGEDKPKPGSNFGNVIWGFTNDTPDFFNKFGDLGKWIQASN